MKKNNTIEACVLAWMICLCNTVHKMAFILGFYSTNNHLISWIKTQNVVFCYLSFFEFFEHAVICTILLL